MLRLASILYFVVGTSLSGIFMIVALVSGYDTGKFIIIAVTVGAVVAIPVSYFVAKAIRANSLD
ncbi:MAG: CTP synthetase [Rhodobacteraceae bacterium]|nr:CTP synthetase [Paracoccaceae bacterium]